MYKRFSIGWTEDEYKKLEDIVSWYQSQVGINMTKSAIIKAVLFRLYKDSQKRQNAIDMSKTNKDVPKKIAREDNCSFNL
jgi:hypothetical protein